MSVKTVWFNKNGARMEFYTDRFYWRDLAKFIPISKPVKIILLACSDKDLNSVFIDKHDCSACMELFRKPQSLETINHFIAINELRVEEFEIQTPDGLVIKQPMWDDLLFTTPARLSSIIEVMMLRSGLPHQLISFLHSNVGKVVCIDEGGMPHILPEFTSLSQYLDYKYDRVNTEINDEMNRLIGGKY